MFRNSLRKALTAIVLTGVLTFTAAPVFAASSGDGSEPGLLDAFWSAVTAMFWADDGYDIDPDGAS